MTAIFIPEGHLFRATERAGGPWSPDMLQGSATSALMVREVERLAQESGFAVRRLPASKARSAWLMARRPRQPRRRSPTGCGRSLAICAERESMERLCGARERL